MNWAKECSVVSERNLLEKWGTHRGVAGRGKYSLPANPKRVTSEALKRRDRGVLKKLRSTKKISH